MIDGLPTGFQKIETLIEALQRSDLVILVIPPSLGQVSLVHSLALKAATGSRRSVALFSPDVNRYLLVQRLLAMNTGINVHRLQAGQLSDE
jgi:replicative DNA helicase